MSMQTLTANPTRLLILTFALGASACLAQGRGPGGPPPGGPGGGHPPLGQPGPGPSHPDVAIPGNATATDAAGHTLQLGPVGRWWDDARYSRTIGINTQQQKRMDAVFDANRDQLARLYGNLKHEQAQLARAGKTTTSEPDLDAEIDRVASARTELQKATTHMLLQIRKELSPDQVAKLDAAR